MNDNNRGPSFISFLSSVGLGVRGRHAGLDVLIINQSVRFTSGEVFDEEPRHSHFPVRFEGNLIPKHY